MSTGIRVTEEGWRLAAAEFVKERDEARRERDEARRERDTIRQARDEAYLLMDAARAAAAACYAWATGGYGAGSPAGLIDKLVEILGVEDYTQLPGWLTEGRR